MQKLVLSFLVTIALPLNTLSMVQVGTIESLPTDVRKLLMEYVWNQKDLSTVMTEIARYRGINKRFNTILHDKESLRKILLHCTYHDSIKSFLPVVEGLSAYSSAILSSSQHSGCEKDWLSLLCEESVTLYEVLENLIGPHNSRSSIQSNPALCQSLLSSYMGFMLEKTHTCSNDQESRVRTICQKKLGCLVAQRELLAHDESLRSALSRCDEMRQVRLDKSLEEPLIRSWDFFFPLTEEIFYRYPERRLELINATSTELLGLIKRNHMLSSEQETFFEDICSKKVPACLLKENNERSMLTPIVVDMGILLATKAGNKECIHALVAMGRGFESRRVSLILMFALLEACWLDVEIGRDLLNFIMQVDRPEVSDVWKLLKRFWLLVMPSNASDITLFCQLCEMFDFGQALAPGQLEKFLQSCSNDDVKALVPCLVHLDEEGELFSFSIGLVIALIHLKGLPNTRHVLRNFLVDEKYAEARKELEDGAFCILKPARGDEFSARNSWLRLLDDGIEEAPGDNLLKTYWVDSFIDGFKYSDHQRIWLDIARFGNRDAAYKLIAEQKTLEPLFLECVLLVALRHGNEVFAAIVADALPVCHGDEWLMQKPLLRWTFFLALNKGFESICLRFVTLHDIARAFDPDSPLGYEVLSMRNLSEAGFLLAGTLGVDKEQEGYGKLRAWLKACWNQDEKGFLTNMPNEVDRVFLMWAFITGRSRVIGMILNNNVKLHQELLSYKDFFINVSRKYPEIAAMMAKFVEDYEK